MNKQPTSQAIALYKALSVRNIHCKLEAWDGYKHIDLSLPWAKMDIEIDGLQHYVDSRQIESDLKRGYHSAINDDFYTMHIPNSAVENNLNDVADAIAEVARKRYYEMGGKNKKISLKNIDKRQLLLIGAIALVTLLLIIALLKAAKNGPFGIDLTGMVTDAIKEAFKVVYALGKLFVILIWSTITDSWLSGLITVGMIALVILYWFYRKYER